jgi:MOSC domain-containing protein YiiM
LSSDANTHWQGRLCGIFIGAEAGAALSLVESVCATAGSGLEGDRYALGIGTFSKTPRPDRQVTLIEQEAVIAVARDYELQLPAAVLRRNLLTEGVPLNHLVGVAFRIGEVRLRGLRLCEPCKHLGSLTDPLVEKALAHRGGLRAKIVEGGTLRVGDAIAPVSD